MLTDTNVPAVNRSDTRGVTTTTARYSLDDRRRAIAELDAAGEEYEVHVVYRWLLAEVHANGRGGASPEHTAYVLALADVYEERQRRRLGYTTVPELAALVGAR